MAEKRKQEEAIDDLFFKRQCVENSDSLKDLNGEEGHVEQEVSDGPAPSWGSQASSSDSSSSSSSGHQPGGDSSSEGSITDSFDMGLGDIRPDSLAGPMGWLQKQMMSGTNPKSILMRIIPSGMTIPEEMDEFEMWSIIAEYLRSIDEPPPRQKLEQYNTFDDAIQLLKTCKNILVLTGAGVSVSCGIPDFRSRDGVYARLAVDFPDLPDPQAMFEISYFRKDPRPFYKFAKELFPGQFKPSTSHKFISQLEQHQKLLRNYTQNIDTLEQAAGIKGVIQCHGSFATATCTRCGLSVDSDAIRDDVFNQMIPICPQCGPDTPDMAVLKPDIVFFGEGLPNHFYDKLNDDKETADLLIVMGSSLKVRPVATIPSLLPKKVPQILINREPLPHLNFDIELLGDCDVIINEILHRLGDGWDHVCQSQQRLTETTHIPNGFKPKESQQARKAVLEEGETTVDQRPDPVLDEGETTVDQRPDPVLDEGETTVDQRSDPVLDEGETTVDQKPDPVLDEGETTVDQKPDPAGRIDQEESVSNPINVKSKEDTQHSLSSLKEEGQVSSGDDKNEGSKAGEGDDRLARSNSQDSPISTEGHVKQSCVERLRAPENQTSSEHHINGLTNEGKIHVDALPCSRSETNCSPSSNSDRLQSADEVENALASSEPQTSKTIPSESSQSHTAQDQTAQRNSAAEQYMLFQRTLDSIGNSSTGASSPDVKVGNDSESTQTHVASDCKEPSTDVKAEAEDLGLCVNETDRTNSQDDLNSEVGNVSSSSGSVVEHREQASPASDSEAKPSPSTSAAAKTPRATISTQLKESSFLFIPPMRYVFHGAEVFLSDDDNEIEHGLEGLNKDMDINDLHNELENGDLHNELENGDLHNHLHNGDDLPDLSEEDHSLAKEKAVSLDDLTPTVPSTDRETSQYGQSASKAQCVPETNGRDGSPFEAPSGETVHTHIDLPVTP
ncbi:NAD-dependent protein deacetylase sirtuin-1 isoform X2 [Strongylocentrotus purpuratus]|uniref:protein acetyllysine N-acetyltransferase n=1 Tax=Strongylocentrotus purpuratus TaxID=7668 RepID=A0A7M7SVZ0_STRPU|nr:NAD-dependent protein deacetylase sirtuin-1 isoform X2 [Strongylocentrotus purpuratus]